MPAIDDVSNRRIEHAVENARNRVELIDKPESQALDLGDFA